MTREELEKYGNLKKETDDLRERIKVIETKAQGVSAIKTDTGGMVKSSPGNTKENILALYIDQQNLYARKLRELDFELKKIEWAISGLVSRERQILRYRFIDGMLYRDIETKVGYSERQLRRIIDEALEKIKDL